MSAFTHTQPCWHVTRTMLACPTLVAGYRGHVEELARCLRAQQPDVVHFVDPIWLGAQTLMAMELGWAGE
jgi:hypothetical protein